MVQAIVEEGSTGSLDYEPLFIPVYPNDSEWDLGWVGNVIEHISSLERVELVEGQHALSSSSAAAISLSGSSWQAKSRFQGRFILKTRRFGSGIFWSSSSALGQSSITQTCERNVCCPARRQRK